MVETIHYEMVECPMCRYKWPDMADNADCVRLHGKCLRCRYGCSTSCVTVDIEIEPGLDKL